MSYSNLFPTTRDVVHRFELQPGSRLNPRIPYRLSHEEKEEIEKQIQELIEQEFIRPSKSTFWNTSIISKEKGWIL